MATGRILLKAISRSKKLWEISDKARELYVFMLPHLDINGNYSADEYVIKGTVWPRAKAEEYSLDKIEAYLQELSSVGLIMFYEANGERHLHYRQFVAKQPGMTRKERPDFASCDEVDKENAHGWKLKEEEARLRNRSYGQQQQERREEPEDADFAEVVDRWRKYAKSKKKPHDFVFNDYEKKTLTQYIKDGGKQKVLQVIKWMVDNWAYEACTPKNVVFDFNTISANIGA